MDPIVLNNEGCYNFDSMCSYETYSENAEDTYGVNKLIPGLQRSEKMLGHFFQ